MKIAITGALGMVGRGVAGLLTLRGHEIRPIDRLIPDEPFEQAYVQANLTSYEEALEAVRGVDAIVHLAGINAPIAAPEVIVHNNNVTSSYNVLSAAAALGIPRVVQSSSVNAIGMSWSRKPVFDSFPVGIDHRTRNEDGYSLSKVIQEVQADSLTRRYDALSVVSLRLHAVLTGPAQADEVIKILGESWAINGLFGYCTYERVADAIDRSLAASISGHERVWIVEPETFSDTPSAMLAALHFPSVPLSRPLLGHESFFDLSRTSEVLG
jgi:nucleoside-diphosphate-sugar epimerase